MKSRRILAPSIAMLLMSVGQPAFSQFSPGQWVGDSYLVENSVKDKSGEDQWFSRRSFIDEKNKISETIPSLKEVIDFPVENKYIFRQHPSHWYDDALYTMAYGYYQQDEDGVLSKTYTFAKWQDNEWHFLGQYKHVLPRDVEYSQLRAFPCDNNRFIVVSRSHDLAGNSGTDISPFVRMSIRPGKKEAEVDHSIYHGIDELKNHMSDKRFFGLAGNCHFMIVTGKYATMINERTGLYWCFSLERATLIKSGSIFKGIQPDEMAKVIDKGGLSLAVLCANPEKDGTVLVSTSEEAALKGEIDAGWDEIQKMTEGNPNLTEEDAKKLLLEHMEKLSKRNPYIAWYRIYPENGRVEKLAVPPIGGATKKKSTFANILALGTANAWRPMPDGSVVMGDIKLGKEPKQSKQPKQPSPAIQPSQTNQKEQAVQADQDEFDQADETTESGEFDE